MVEIVSAKRARNASALFVAIAFVMCTNAHVNAQPGPQILIPAAAVPQQVRETFNAGFHVSANVVVAAGAKCTTQGQEFSKVVGWFHNTSEPTDADKANGIRTIDVYVYKVKIYRDRSSEPWRDIALDPNADAPLGGSPGGAAIFKVAYVHAANGTHVTSIMNCFSM